MSSLDLLLLSLNQFIKCEKIEKNRKTCICFPKKYKVSKLKDLLPLSYNDCLLLIHYIYLQQSFLEKKGCGFYKLALEDISVIESSGLDSNENILMFAYLNHSNIKKINEYGNIVFMTPFSNNTGFCCPEILAIKNIPCCVSHKCFYYSLGLLCNECLGSGSGSGSRLDYNIKNTKLYWVLQRLLVYDPKKRVLLLV